MNKNSGSGFNVGGLPKGIMAGVAGVLILFLTLPVMLTMMSDANAAALIDKLGAYGYKAFIASAGDTTFNGDVLPNADNTQDVGSAALSWANGYFDGTVTADSLAAPTGRGAAFTVAASNSSALCSSQADYLCDGTNDEVTIKAATEALPATGGSLWFAPGTYYIDATLALTRANFTWSLDPGAILYQHDGMNAVMISVNSGGATIYDLVVRGGLFDGNKAGQVGSWDIFNLTWVKNSRFEDVHFRNASDCGVKATNLGGVYNQVNNCYFDSCTNGTNGMDVYSSLMNDVSIAVYNGSAIGNKLLGITHGGGYGGIGQRVIGNYMTAGAAATLSAWSLEYNTEITGFIFADNFVDFTGATASNGIGLSPNVDNVIIRNIEITGNVFKGINQKAVNIAQFAGWTGCSISNVTIENNDFDTCGYGVFVDYPATGGAAVPNNIRIGSNNRFTTIANAPVYPRGNNITMEYNAEAEYSRTFALSNYTVTTSAAAGGITTGTDVLLLNSGGGAGGTATGYVLSRFTDNSYTVNYDKWYLIDIQCYRTTSANTVFYLKLDDDTANTDPDSMAIGFKIVNLDVFGLAYDGSLDTLDLSTALTDIVTSSLRVWHVPTIGVFFYVNGTFCGMSDHEPSGTLSNGEAFTMSIYEPDGTEARAYISQLNIRRQK